MLLRRIGFFLLAILALLALLYSGDKIYLYFLCAFFLIILFSLLQLILSCLSLTLHTTISAPESEKMKPFTWFLYPKAKLFPISHVKIITTVPESLSGNTIKEAYATSIASHTSFEIPIVLTYDYTGKYTFSIYKVVVSDIFGLFTYTFRQNSKRLPPSQSILILPEVTAFSYPSANLENQSDMIKTNERNEPAGIREYIRGDQMNRIHWKYTARAGKLHVKEYEKYTKDTHIIFLDLANPNLQGIRLNKIKDLLLGRVASLCANLISNGSPVILLCYKEDVSGLVSVEYRDKDEMRRFLADCNFYKSLSQIYMDPLSSSLLSDMTDFTIFSASTTPQFYEDIAKTASYITSVMIYLIPQRDHIDEQKELVHKLSDQGFFAELLTDDSSSVQGGGI